MLRASGIRRTRRSNHPTIRRPSTLVASVPAKRIVASMATSPTPGSTLPDHFVKYHPTKPSSVQNNHTRTLMVTAMGKMTIRPVIKYRRRRARMRSGGQWLDRHPPADAHSGDPMALQLLDGNDRVAGGHRLSRHWHMPEPRVHEPADRVHLPHREVQAHQLVDFLDAQPAIHDGATSVDTFEEFLFDIIFVPDRPHNLLEQIGHRHEPGRAPVFVYYNRNLRPAAHLAEQVVEPLALRNEVRRPHDLRRGQGVVSCLDVAEDVLDVHNPYDLVDGVVVHGNPG